MKVNNIEFVIILAIYFWLPFLNALANVLYLLQFLNLYDIATRKNSILYLFLSSNGHLTSFMNFHIMNCMKALSFRINILQGSALLVCIFSSCFVMYCICTCQYQFGPAASSVCSKAFCFKCTAYTNWTPQA